jgi:hypothetical protein
MPRLPGIVRDRCRAIGKERKLKNWWDDRDAVEEQAYKDLDRVQPPRRKRQKKAAIDADAECCVCMDTVPLVILVPCGHMRTCAACFGRCQHRCPTCRAVVTSVVDRVFA